MENVKKNAIPMKTLNDAIEMRNTILKKRKLRSAKTFESVVKFDIHCWWRTNRGSFGMYAGMKMQHVITDNFRRRQP
jgi:hypothetical protein